MSGTPAEAAFSRFAVDVDRTAMRSATHPAEAFTVGMEEELFLVNEAELQCVEQMPEAFRLEAKAALGDHVKREVIGSMVELVTSVHHSLADAGEELRFLRTTLAQIAQRHGLALLACGTHPFANWREQRVTPKPRYDAVAESLGSLVKRVHACGLHTHVAVHDPEVRISVMNRIQRFLPILLALSTSSAFWRGEPTGLKSYRSAANDETPRNGLPTRFRDEEEFQRFVAKLTAAGYIPDQTFLWWSIRPSLRFPTLELRITDCCTQLGHAVALAALYRCLVHTLAGDPAIAAEWEDHHYLLNCENRWQAMRYGLEARLIEPVTGATETVATLARSLVRLLEPSALQLGCADELRSVEAILENGTSSDRQLRVYEEAMAQGASPAEATRRVAAEIAALTLSV
ncbi:MAG TPA: carboxylate-amine ligase [Hyphomicrobiaceae bacterium]|nr:carboxylate-amine ligase [Hyphomicrobiaceae bacterium]